MTDISKLTASLTLDTSPFSTAIASLRKLAVTEHFLATGKGEPPKEWVHLVVGHYCHMNPQAVAAMPEEWVTLHLHLILLTKQYL